MDKEEKISKIIQLLKAKGFKPTRSRKTIIRLFVETTEHLKPEQVYLLTRDQGISLPTVYRTIDMFKKNGIIQEVVIQNDRYYELCMYSQKKLHIHFQCSECGEIKEYSDQHIFSEIIEQRDYIEGIFHDEIEDITIVMSGICHFCKNSTHMNYDKLVSSGDRHA